MKRKSRKSIRAAIDLSVDLRLGNDDPFKVEAAADGKGPPRLMIHAYSGVPFKQWWSQDPVVVNLAGMKLPAKAERLVLLMDHDPSRPIGNATSVRKTESDLYVEGIASVPGPDTDKFVQSSKNGFPWRASQGANKLKVAYIQEDEVLEVNGKEFPGPLTHVVSCELQEVSVVTMGADDDTDSVAASDQERDEIMKRIRATATGKEPVVDPKAPVKAGADPKNPTTVTDPEQVAQTVKAKAGAEPGVVVDELQAQRERQAVETERTSAIRAIAGIDPKIEAQAIRENWTVEKTELTVLRASRPTGVNVIIQGAPSVDNPVLQAALCQTLGLESIEKKFQPQVLEAADKAFHGRIGLQQLIVEAARRNGYNGSPFLRSDSDMKQAIRAAFSSDGLDSVFLNVMNMFLMTAFNAVEDTWRDIAKIDPSVNDFRQYSTYANISDLIFEDLGANGKIKHGVLKDQGYTNKLSTRAKMISITREDIINDAIGILRDMTQKLGRGAGLKLNEDFWTCFLDDAAFFTAGNKNLLTGAGTALAHPGLKAAQTAFRKQVGPDGYPLGVEASILLTPPELEVTSAELMTSTLVNTGGAATDRQVPNRNIWGGKFKQSTSVYLSGALKNAAGTALGSSSAWYLVAKPEDLPVITVGFLRGAVSPTIQQVQPNSDDLGIVMRGWFDYGVSKQVTQAAIKSAGV